MRRSDLFAWDGPVGSPNIERGVHLDPVSAITTAASIGGSLLGAGSKSDAASNASAAQIEASKQAQEGLDSRINQFMTLLAPYTNAGAVGMDGMLGLMGLNGPAIQKQAINGIQSSPGFTSALKVGENSILQNAAATGGLRGGNTQAAMAQFAPELLAQQINQRFGQLGGLATLGQNSVMGFGQSALGAQKTIADLQTQAGAAAAGNALAQGQVESGLFGSIGSSLGGFLGGLKF